jgi:PAS domain S-box-containing protein
MLLVLAALAVLTPVYALADRRGMPRGPHLLLQFGLDILLVSALVTATGGAASPYTLFYVLVSVTAGLCLLPRGGLVVAAMASVAFAAIALGELTQHGAGVFHGVPGVCLHAGSFFTAAALGGVLGERLTMRSSALKKTKSELSRARMEADFIVKNISGGLLTIDGKGSVLYLNPMAERILECTVTEARGRPLPEVLGDGKSPFAQRVLRSLSTGCSVLRDELLITRDDGTDVPIGASISVLPSPALDRVGAIALFQDLTEAKAKEEADHQRERLAAIGELAAGIAHEMRNCLKPLGGSVDLLRRELVLSGENAHLMDLILRQTETLEGFVRDLLSYAREHPLARHRADVREIVHDVLATVERHPAKSDSKRIVERFPEGPIFVNADSDAIRQVFTNLALNALEAMESGTLVVAADAPVAAPTGERRRSGPAEERSFVRISFTDDGHGIPVELRDQVFKPFFTTKRGGSGLGLSIAQRIVERHGGKLSLSASSDSGTMASVYLPWEA